MEDQQVGRNAEEEEKSLDRIVEIKGEEEIQRTQSVIKRVTSHIRTYSERSIGRDLGVDQSVKGLIVVLSLVTLFLVFIFFFNWVDVYLFVFNLFKVDK